MGIVLKQSLSNTLVTYLGFAFGAINTLFLYTQILTPSYYGLVTFILATAAILMPLMAFGVHNTMVKFYSSQAEAEKNGFLTLMLFSPLLAILPLGVLTWIFYEDVAAVLSQKNELVKDYVWYVFAVALATAYFEVFFAWSRIHLKSVFGNFMKEVFARIGVMLLLGLYYFGFISLDAFFKCLVGLYLLRTIIMKLYAYKLRWPKLDLNFPKDTKNIVVYSLLIILGGSAALILLEIDKVMINQFKAIENVAYYGVAIYIATVIIVPSRAMHQITYPLTAELLNKGDFFELDTLYKKTSLTLFIASGLLFILIILNVEDLYRLLPEAYGQGFYIVFLIGLAKVFDSFLGNINSILYNSQHYKTVLLFGVCLALVTILLNLWLIPKLGIEGAALASFIAIFLFNTIKVVFVKVKFGLLPFSKGTAKVFATLLLLGFLFTYLNLGFHPILNILIKSFFIVLVYLSVLYYFQISEDVTGLLNKILKPKGEE
ncbi:polysaccharide biosynthesis C-terminal domain-containing protein [uncultured Croceitalea sp.]|uniref:lipopolysaccharide biosynthesis protein n=1 Tax=uncultured Croceitalea sp. TaxID=1798908 RepID=UPI00330576F0